MGEANVDDEMIEEERENGDLLVEKFKPEYGGACSLTWKDLSVTIALRNGKTQTILNEISGYAEAGTLTAVMGPSGSGKSTLLDALSGRLAADAFLAGAILLNGRKAKLSFGTVVSLCNNITFLYMFYLIVSWFFTFDFSVCFYFRGTHYQKKTQIILSSSKMPWTIKHK